MREQKQGWNVVQKQPPKPSASTSRGFPLRYATSYDNASFNLQQKAAGGLQKRGQPRVKYPEKRFRKQPPPKPRPVFLLPTRYRGPAPTRKGYRVEQLHFGVLDRDGSTFHSELQPTFVDGHLDTELDAEFLHITAEAFDKLPIRIVIAFDSVESFIVDHTAGSGGTLLLTLSFAPSLEVFTSPSPMDVVRVTAYSADHRQIAPYTSRHILLTFSSSDVLLPLLVALESLPLPRPTVKILSVTHKHLQHYSQEKLLAFRVRLGSIPPPYAFQFEAILHEGLLFPFEFTELFESRILELDVIHGELVTERILVELKKRLSSDRMARTTEVLLLDAAAAEAREPVELPPFSLGGLLEESVHAVVESREQLHLVTDDQHFLCRHVCTTPTTMSFTGPFVEQVRGATTLRLLCPKC